MFVSFSPTTAGHQCAFYFLSEDVRAVASKKDGNFPQLGIFPGFYKAGPKHVAVLDALGWSANDIEQAKKGKGRGKGKGKGKNKGKGGGLGSLDTPA